MIWTGFGRRRAELIVAEPYIMDFKDFICNLPSRLHVERTSFLKRFLDPYLQFSGVYVLPPGGNGVMHSVRKSTTREEDKFKARLVLPRDWNDLFKRMHDDGMDNFYQRVKIDVKKGDITIPAEILRARNRQHTLTGVQLVLHPKSYEIVRDPIEYLKD